MLKKFSTYANIIYEDYFLGGIKMSKKRYDAGKILTKVLAGILAGIMVLSVAATLIWYLFVL